MAGWTLRDLLWIDRNPLANILEFFFDPGIVSDTFDSLGSGVGTLTNGNRTLLNGKAAVRNDYPYQSLSGAVPGPAWVAEIVIDAGSSAMRFGMGACAQFQHYREPDRVTYMNFYYPTTYWRASGFWKNGTTYSGGYDNGPVIEDMVTWDTGDVIGILFTYDGFMWFKNGVRVPSSRSSDLLWIPDGYTSPPIRIVLEANSGAATLRTDKTSMTYLSAYQAYANALSRTESRTISSWPSP